MEVTKEEENLFRARKVIDDDLLTLLREFFMQKWNAHKDPTEPAWSDDSRCGDALLKKRKGASLDKHIRNKLKSGETFEWDATCLFEAILVFVKGREECSICILRKQRNMVFHRSQPRLSNDEKDDFFEIIKKEYENLKWPTDDVDRIKTESITTEEMKKLKSKLESEKRKGRVLKAS